MSYSVTVHAGAKSSRRPRLSSSRPATGLPSKSPRPGLTLIEIMIALTMTLIVLSAMMVAFRYASEQMANGRAMIEMTNQLRSAQSRLRSDLGGLTVDVRPGAQLASPMGYFEYIEGVLRDNSTAATVNNLFGDLDDVLAMTTRTSGTPFRGRALVGGSIATVESNAAEVVWWTDYDDRNGNGSPDYDEPIRLYRRELLIRPDLPPVPAPDATAVQQFFLLNDISARWDRVDSNPANWLLIPNSIDDLARRENRFAHLPLVIQIVGGVPQSANFPHRLDRTLLRAFELSEFNLATLGNPLYMSYVGQDVVLSNLAAFDVRIFSPNTPVQMPAGSDIPLAPADPGYGVASNVGFDFGAFVDLGYAATPFGLGPPLPPAFSTLPTIKSQLGGTPDIPYCTFSSHYEADGLDNDFDGLVDEGTDGLDNDSANGVDDEGERETAPPYPFAIEGIQVTIRLIEPNTRQVKESSIVERLSPRR